MPDREKVIKELEWQINVFTLYCASDERLLEAMKAALVLLKDHGWNALTEDADGFIHGLPGDDGQYLMTDGKDIWIDDYVDGVADGIILDSGRDIREITAWMYMPELPKKERSVKWDD